MIKCLKLFNFVKNIDNMENYQNSKNFQFGKLSYISSIRIISTNIFFLISLKRKNRIIRLSLF